MAGLRIGLIQRPIQGESVCGDAYGVFDQGDFVIVVVADGLGHGPEAHAASEAAIALVAGHVTRSVEALLEDCHNALKRTRGAAMGIARIDRLQQTITYGGVGNIEARLIGVDVVKRPISLNGIIGYNARKFNSETFVFQTGDMLLMHSDGISDRIDLPLSARRQDPQMLAYQLAVASGRPSDDQLILIVADAR